MIVHLVRHAKAGSRSRWVGPDADRPLDERGRDQAAAIAERLRATPIARLVSSPALRCTQTVGPLAGLLGLDVAVHAALAEGSSRRAVHTLLDEVLTAAPADAADDVVLCSHGDVIPELLDDLRAAGVELDRPGSCAKGSVWELHVRDGRITHGTYVPAP